MPHQYKAPNVRKGGSNGSIGSAQHMSLQLVAAVFRQVTVPLEAFQYSGRYSPGGGQHRLGSEQCVMRFGGCCKQLAQQHACIPKQNVQQC